MYARGSKNVKYGPGTVGSTKTLFVIMSVKKTETASVTVTSS